MARSIGIRKTPNNMSSLIAIPNFIILCQYQLVYNQYRQRVGIAVNIQFDGNIFSQAGAVTLGPVVKDGGLVCIQDVA
jgi:hypothetical protein